MAEIRNVSADRLEPDPDNPRAFFPPEDVQAMAQSIQEGRGVDQALIVTEDPEKPGHYRLIDGHVRWAAAKMLGAAAPRLKCEVRPPMPRRERLLIMARTSRLHFDKDALSEARHYLKLLTEEGMSQIELARAIGASPALIASRLRLLELDPEVQEFVAAGQLSKDPRVVSAINSIEDRAARLKLAAELARRRASIRSCEMAAERLRLQLAQTGRHEKRRQARRDGQEPSLQIAAERLDGELPPDEVRRTWPAVREAAAQACRACDVRASVLEDIEEPAWTILAHGAEQTCRDCGLARVRAACESCPLPEYLVRLVRSTEREHEAKVARGNGRGGVRVRS